MTVEGHPKLLILGPIESIRLPISDLALSLVISEMPV